MIPCGRGLFHPMGALIFSNETYRETLPIIDASGLPSMAFGNRGAGNWIYDYGTGHVQDSTSSISNIMSSSLFQAEIDKYINFWNTEFAPLATIGYKVRDFSDKIWCSTLTDQNSGWSQRVHYVGIRLAVRERISAPTPSLRPRYGPLRIWRC
jgi:hypothetical protein